MQTKTDFFSFDAITLPTLYYIDLSKFNRIKVPIPLSNGVWKVNADVRVEINDQTYDVSLTNNLVILFYLLLNSSIIY